MKLNIILSAVVLAGALCASNSAHAGWNWGLGPADKILGCTLPMTLDQCFLFEKKYKKKSVGGDHWRGGKRVYPTNRNYSHNNNNYSYSVAKMQKPSRVMVDPRVK